MLNPNPEKRAGLDDIFLHAWFLKVGPRSRLPQSAALHRAHAPPCRAGRCGRSVQPRLACTGASPPQVFIRHHPRHPRVPATHSSCTPAFTLQDLPPGALGMNDWYMDNADSLQDRLEVVQTIVVRVCVWVGGWVVGGGGGGRGRGPGPGPAHLALWL